MTRIIYVKKKVFAIMGTEILPHRDAGARWG